MSQLFLGQPSALPRTAEVSACSCSTLLGTRAGRLLGLGDGWGECGGVAQEGCIPVPDLAMPGPGIIWHQHREAGMMTVTLGSHRAKLITWSPKTLCFIANSQIHLFLSGGCFDKIGLVLHLLLCNGDVSKRFFFFSWLDFKLIRLKDLWASENCFFGDAPWLHWRQSGDLNFQHGFLSETDQ